MSQPDRLFADQPPGRRLRLRRRDRRRLRRHARALGAVLRRDPAHGRPSSPPTSPRDGTAIYDLGCSTCDAFLRHRTAAAPRQQGALRRHRLFARHARGGRAQARREPAFPFPVELRRGGPRRAASRSTTPRSCCWCSRSSSSGRSTASACIADIYRGLRPDGCLILVEKVLGENSLFNRLFIKPLLRDEAPQRLQRARDRAEARGARERAGAVPRSRRTANCCARPASGTWTCSSSGTTSAG